MSDTLTIITNHVPRFTIDAHELTNVERAQFDYIDWNKVDEGIESATFIRYKGDLMDLGEFMTTSGMPEFSPLRQWHGYSNDSFFSGVVVKFVDNDDEAVIVGRFYA